MEKIVIIGAGPAGISAALYAVRGNADPLVIDNGKNNPMMLGTEGAMQRRIMKAYN